MGQGRAAGGIVNTSAVDRAQSGEVLGSNQQGAPQLKNAESQRLRDARFRVSTGGGYVAEGKSLKEVKTAIGFDTATGMEHQVYGGLAEGEIRIVLETPNLLALFVRSTLLTNAPSRTTIRLREGTVQ